MHNRDSASAEFRRDINGQRALAVAVVVLYHFGVPGFGGGFAGAVLCFVILAAAVSHEIQHGSLLGRPFHHDDDHPSEYGNQPLAPVL